MQKSDKLKFSAIIRGFEIQSTRKLKKEEKKQLLKFYFTNLKQFSIEQVERAGNKLLKTWEYPTIPTIGSFVKAIEGDLPMVEDTALVQASDVLSQVRVLGSWGTPEFEDPITRALMETRFNFRSLCQSLPEKDEQWFIRQFIEAYRSFDREKDNLLIDAPKKVKKLTQNMFESV